METSYSIYISGRTETLATQTNTNKKVRNENSEPFCLYLNYY
jgi:hypothetical protein